jgi:hypothetical protein
LEEKVLFLGKVWDYYSKIRHRMTQKAEKYARNAFILEEERRSPLLFT